MQIRMTLRFYIIQVRMAKNNKAMIANAGKDAGKGDTSSLLGSVQTGTIIVETSVAVPQEAGNRSTLRSSTYPCT